MSAHRITLLLLSLLLFAPAEALPLRAGWNPVGFGERSLTRLEASGPVTTLASWNGSSYVLSPVRADQVDGRKGYWVLAQGEATLRYAGTTSGPQDLELAAGWNLVAFPGVGQADLTVPAHVLGTFYEIQPEGSYIETPARVRSERSYWVYAASPARLSWNAVAPPLGALTVAPPQATLQRLAFTSFTAAAGGEDVTAAATWTSSDPSVAALTEPGQVRALNVGQAEIRADFGGATARAVVTVVDTGVVGPVVPTASPSPARAVSALFPNLLMFPAAQDWLVASADFNEDGRPDLGTATSTGPYVALSKARAGTFVTPSPVATASCNVTASGDFNGDGHQDLATNSNAGAQVLLYFGKGDGLFDPAVAITTPLSTSSGGMASGDLNADGRPDLLVGLTSSANVCVLLSTATPGDFTVQQLACGGGPAGHTAAIADVTGDGRPDLILGRAVAFVVIPSTGAGTFGPPQVTSRQVRDVAVADLNGDGRNDLAFGLVGSDVTYYLSTGPGTWNTPVTLAGLGGGTRAGRVGDFNADGRPDLVGVDSAGVGTYFEATGAPGNFAPGVAFTTVVGVNRALAADLDGDGVQDLLCSGDNGQQVHFGGGSPFLNSSAFAAGSGPQTLAAGDLTGDNRPDLVVGSSGTTISVLLAAGAPGSFGAPATSTITGSLVNHLALRDLDADGRLDLTYAIEANSPLNLSTALGLPGGAFAFPGAALMAGGQLYGFDLADLNGDGRPDLVAALGVGILRYFLATGPAAYGSGQDLALGSGGAARYPLVADFNGDGRQDIAVSRSVGNLMTVMLASAGGGFEGPASYPVGSQPFGVAAADFNGDGRLDLATANLGDGSVSVLLAAGSPGTFAPATSFGAAGSPREVQVADLNGDGRLDLVVPSQTANLGRVAVLLAAGPPGSFDSPDLYRCGTNSRAALVLDADQNGTLDIITADNGSDTVTVMPGRRR